MIFIKRIKAGSLHFEQSIDDVDATHIKNDAGVTLMRVDSGANVFFLIEGEEQKIGEFSPSKGGLWKFESMPAFEGFGDFNVLATNDLLAVERLLFKFIVSEELLK
jgi:hypothetical protein